ncbi:MAG: acyltransferase, partial [Paludibacteraceae bacterium]|nr:acyltransferase [Paludibacteraceae bacterium]
SGSGKTTVVNAMLARDPHLELVKSCTTRPPRKDEASFEYDFVSDELFNENRFAGEYTKEEKQRFDDYLEGQLQKIELENKDSVYLRTKMLEMYANPLVNHLKAIE